jgi:twinkle protein
MFNYDRCNGQKEIIICEGEFDCMAFEEAGFTNVTSVNQGAPNENDKNIDKKLECITRCYEMFDNAEKIYLATDNDANGRRLKDELIRRLGAERCFSVDLSDCKDANEYLIKYNKLSLLEVIKNAKEIPIDGIFTAENEKLLMLDSFRNGKKRGQTTHWEDIDKAWTWRTGEVTIWTGYQNEGKSLFLQSLCLLRAFHDSEKFAFFSPENIPIGDFFDDMIETFVGKSTDPHYKHNQMGESEYLQSIDFISEHFVDRIHEFYEDNKHFCIDEDGNWIH